MVGGPAAQIIDGLPEGHASPSSVEGDLVERSVLIAHEQPVAGLSHDRSEHARGQPRIGWQIDLTGRPQLFGQALVEQYAGAQANLGIVVGQGLFESGSRSTAELEQCVLSRLA